jgi:hypothetical protein
LDDAAGVDRRLHLLENMDGVVTTRHLVIHASTIAREFGVRCLVRCFWRVLTARHRVTFLECAVGY